jgi:hypothetical protein
MIVIGKLLESDVARRKHRCPELYSAASLFSSSRLREATEAE